MSENEREYVLGTHDAEIERLGIQHRVWREMVLEGWRRAEIGSGQSVLDVGCGPGYAAMDLAAMVGPSGKVVGVEQSARFVSHAQQMAEQIGHAQFSVVEMDLMTDPLPSGPFDAAWCRWVACFLPDPDRLVQQLFAAVRPGGRVIFHEYACYESWRFAPPMPVLDEFVREVIGSWREAGGEPNIALELPRMLGSSGFKVSHIAPLLYTVRPGDPMWDWPESFMSSGVDRLVSLGRVTEDFADRVRVAYASAKTSAHTVMMTPVVWEIVAERT